MNRREVLTGAAAAATAKLLPKAAVAEALPAALPLAETVTLSDSPSAYYWVVYAVAGDMIVRLPSGKKVSLLADEVDVDTESSGWYLVTASTEPDNAGEAQDQQDQHDHQK